MSLSALWAERLGEVGHGMPTSARSQSRQILNFEAISLSAAGNHPQRPLTSPSLSPRYAGGEEHEAMTRSCYFAGCGCLKTGTPSVLSSSASAPSVGRIFTQLSAASMSPSQTSRGRS